MNTSPLAFLKGHGTENDFVIVPDPDNVIDLPASAVARLCDRRAGIGGDGVLHAVRSAAHPEAKDMAGEAEWFMDYRNSDGSIAEMCGNGVRVFAAYLQRAGLVEPGDLAVATRGGVKKVHLAKGGEVTVSMGRALLPEESVTVTVDGRSWPARNVNMGNPHAVAFVADLDHAGELRSVPPFAPSDVYPDGVNIEFVVDRGPGHVAMRVHERGAGRPAPAAPVPARSPSPPRAGTASTPRSPAPRLRTRWTCRAAPWSSPSTRTVRSR